MGRLHPVFHTRLLKPYEPDVEHPQHVPPPPPGPIFETDPELYEVEELLSKRTRRNVTQYLVRFLNYGPEADEWIAARNITPDLIQAFESRRTEPKARKGKRRTKRKVT